MVARRNIPNNKDDNKLASSEKQKQEIAKQYGLSLSNIEHIKTDNGKEFFKFFNPKTRELKIVENQDYNHSLKKQFTSVQQELSYAQSLDAVDNATSIYEHTARHDKTEVDLVSLVDLKNDRFKYTPQINRLSTVDRKKVRALLRCAKEIRLRKINIENAIGIDEDNRVIDVAFDYQNNRATIKRAEVLNYQDNKDYTNDESELAGINDIDFNAIAEKITIVDDMPVVTNSEEIITVGGESIDMNQAAKFYQMPEAMERMDLKPRKKNIYRRIVKAIGERIALNNKKVNEKPKVLVKTDDRKAA